MEAYKIQEQEWLNRQMQYQSNYMNTIYGMQWLQISQFGYNYSKLEWELEYPGDIFVFQPPKIAEEDTPEDMEK